jgi:tetratricopeptide (TPR) repeat protein
MALFNLASLAEAAGPPGQSETLIKDAIAQIGERLGRRLLYLDLLRDLAQTQAAAGHFREAEASIAESEEISASLDTGPSARSRGESLRAALFHLQGRGVEGLAAARKAVEITEAEGPEASEYKSARALEGVLAEDAGMHALAEERLKPVVDACLSGALAMPEVDWYLASLAKAYLFSGRASLALPLLERALKDMDSGRPSLGERADIEFGLARTLIELGKDRPRALALAAAAIEELKPYPELMSRLETVQAWVDRMTLLSSKRTER